MRTISLSNIGEVFYFMKMKLIFDSKIFGTVDILVDY